VQTKKTFFLLCHTYSFFSHSLSSSILNSSYDVLLIGDMFFDEPLGEKVMKVAREFPGIALVGDPGRWFLANQQKQR
jgi:predicted nicotinamide N-methyase